MILEKHKEKQGGNIKTSLKLINLKLDILSLFFYIVVINGHRSIKIHLNQASLMKERKNYY